MTSGSTPIRPGSTPGTTPASSTPRERSRGRARSSSRRREAPGAAPRRVFPARSGAPPRTCGGPRKLHRMSAADSTCWTVITAAARGGAAERDDFARRYAEPIRAYLAARWRGTKHLSELDDAVQEVFVECFRGGGALARVEVGRAGGFRAFLYGVVRHVALRFEAGGAARGRGAGEERGAIDFDALPADDPTLSRAFDRAWVQALLAMAVAAQE